MDNESGGRPILLHELVKGLLRGTFAGGVAGTAPSVQSLLVERWTMLPRPHRDLVELLAVNGRPLFQSLAMQAAGIPSGDMRSVDELVESHLVRVVPTGAEPALEVYHEKVREAILEQPGRGSKLQLAQQRDRSGPLEMGSMWKLYVHTDDCAALHGRAGGAGQPAVHLAASRPFGTPADGAAGPAASAAVITQVGPPKWTVADLHLFAAPRGNPGNGHASRRPLPSRTRIASPKE